MSWKTSPLTPVVVSLKLAVISIVVGISAPDPAAPNVRVVEVPNVFPVIMQFKEPVASMNTSLVPPNEGTLGKTLLRITNPSTPDPVPFRNRLQSQTEPGLVKHCFYNTILWSHSAASLYYNISNIPIKSISTN